MKPRTADPTITPMPHEELIVPIEPPTEASDDPDVEALEDQDVREDDERQSKL